MKELCVVYIYAIPIQGLTRPTKEKLCQALFRALLKEFVGENTVEELYGSSEAIQLLELLITLTVNSGERAVLFA